jgi:hypothetical protein
MPSRTPGDALPRLRSQRGAVARFRTSMQERLPFAREPRDLRAMLGLAMGQVEQLETIRSFPAGTALGATRSTRRGSCRDFP